MNIKTRQISKIGLLVSAVFVFALILIVPSATAATADELCKNKVRVEACKDGIAETCKSRTTASSKERCAEERAADFAASKGAASNDALLRPNAKSTGGDTCGNKNAVETRFNFGCIGKDGPANMGPVEDLLYSFIRFLSAGVGLIVVLLIIISGIQYSSSEGNPEATQAAKSRIQNAVVGLFIYMFAFAIVQFLVPGGVFAGSMIVPIQNTDIIEVIHA